MRRRRKRIILSAVDWRALLAGLCLLPLFGCALPRTTNRKVLFSPDGATIAYFREDYWAEPVVDGKILSRNIHVCWAATQDLRNVRSIHVGSAGLEFASYINIPMDLKFSPDSKHLAVLTPGRLTVVDPGSGLARRLTRRGEFVTSYQWLGRDEIGYAAHSNLRGKHQELTDRTFWRHGLGDTYGHRKRTYSESGVKAGAQPTVHPPLEYWSPNARYVIFMSPAYRGQFQLLDVAAGTVRAFGRAGDHLEGVSWKPDSSGAFCVSDVTGNIGNRQALLVDPETANIHDCSREFRKAFPSHAPQLEPLWTADGKFVIANDHTRLGGCLVRPQPWKVIPVGRRMAEHLSPRPRRAPSASRLPVPGWVVLTAYGLNGKYAADEAPKFAVSYDGERSVLLFDAPGWWAFSPDGKVATTISWDGKLTLHKFGDLTRNAPPRRRR